MNRVLFYFTVFFLPLFASTQNLSGEAQFVYSANTNSRFTAFHKGLSQSVYILGVSVPTGFILKGVLSKDSVAIQHAWRIGIASAGNSIITSILKASIKRQRPFQSYSQIHAFDEHAGGYSMPSGHSATAFNLAGNLSLAFPKWYVVVPSYVYATWVAYSRIQLGVHYPSDVFIGALIGTGTAWLSYKIHKRIVQTSKFNNK